MQLTLAVTIGVYLILIFALALMARRRVKTEEDYLVAGRRLPLPLATATLLATWFGAGTLLTATDEIRAEGLRVTALEPYGAGLCLILAAAGSIGQCNSGRSVSAGVAYPSVLRGRELRRCAMVLRSACV